MAFPSGTELILTVEDTSLNLTVEQQELRLTIPVPVDVNQQTLAANVGGGSGTFRDKVANTLNFRSLVGNSPITVQQVGDTVEISTSVGSSQVTIDTVDPTVTDDSNAGFSVGNFWINTTNDTGFLLVDATIGAAVWTPFVGQVWEEDEFTATAGQITFILSNAPSDPESFALYVNGVLINDVVNYTRSGVTVTWLNILFTMGDGDEVIARYR